MKFRNALLTLFSFFFVLGAAFGGDEETTNMTDSSPRYLVLATSRMKTLNAELDHAVAQGYVFAFGEPASKIIVLEKRPGDSHKYLVSDSLSRMINDGSYKGYRILPGSFSSAEYALGGILEHLKEGEPQPEYKVTTTISTRNLEKDIGEASAGGFRAIALTGLKTQTALLEKLPGSHAGATSYRLLATKKISTMEEEIAAAAAQNFKVVAATGAGNEILVLMEQMAAGEKNRDYKVISTTRTSTFEEEINHAAAEGYQIVRQTGAALQKGSIFMGGNYGYEQAIVMEKRPESAKVRYLLLGAKREGTIQRELNTTPAMCSIDTMFLTYQETVTLLRCAAN